MGDIRTESVLDFATKKRKDNDKRFDCFCPHCHVLDNFPPNVCRCMIATDVCFKSIKDTNYHYIMKVVKISNVSCNFNSPLRSNLCGRRRGWAEMKNRRQ